MTRTLVLSTLLTPLLLSTPGAAQTTSAPALVDAKWSAYLGCWRDVDDPSGNGARICVTPDGAGVRMSTIVAGQRVRDEVHVADGVARAVDADGCRGTETARWSAIGQRVYRRAAVACEGGEPRTLSTASYFVAGPTWVDIETVDHDGSISVRVSRLVRAGNQMLADGTTPGRSAARGPAAEAMARFSVADVIDLSGALPPDGVQAAIAEAPTTFRLNAEALSKMADAKVGPLVIDLMVGLTYPKKFQVSRLGSGGGGGGGLGMMGMGMADPFFAAIVGPAAFNCYSPYGWAQSSYWGNCAGYDPYMASMYPGYYNGYWGAYGPGWVVTQPSTGSGGPTTPVQPQGEGRLVNGRGYTQVQPVVSASTMTADGSSRSSGQSNGGSSSGGGSNSGVSSSGGYSGGGGASSGGGDRTAVPRGPGGR